MPIFDLKMADKSKNVMSRVNKIYILGNQRKNLHMIGLSDLPHQKFWLNPVNYLLGGLIQKSEQRDGTEFRWNFPLIAKK